MSWHLSWPHLSLTGWSSIKSCSSMATHWAARALITSQGRCRVLAGHWSQVLVQPLTPLLPWRGAGQDTTPAVGRHVPLFLSTFAISITVTLIIRTFFIRSLPHPLNTRLLICKKRKWNTSGIGLFWKQNQGLHEAGAKWDSANTWPLHRLLHCTMFCCWCSCRLYVTLNKRWWAALPAGSLLYMLRNRQKYFAFLATVIVFPDVRNEEKISSANTDNFLLEFPLPFCPTSAFLFSCIILVAQSTP